MFFCPVEVLLYLLLLPYLALVSVLPEGQEKLNKTESTDAAGEQSSVCESLPTALMQMSVGPSMRGGLTANR